KGTPYGTSVIGDIQDIKTVSREKILEYFKEFYAPNNAVIVIVGDVEAKRVFSEMEEKFGNIPPYKKLANKKEKLLKEKGGFEFKWSGKKEIALSGISPQPKFMLAFPGIKIGEREAFALDLLSSVLGQGESSSLYQAFVKGKKPKLSSIYAANYTLIDSGVFFISGELLKGASLKTVEKELSRELKKGCNEALTERNLQKVKNTYLVS